MALWPDFGDLMDEEVARYKGQRPRSDEEVQAFKNGLRRGQKVSLTLVYGFDMRGLADWKQSQIKTERALRILGIIPRNATTDGEVSEHG